MAQYYTKRPPRNTLLGAQPPSGQQKAPVASRDKEATLAAPNTSFYIFPNPSELSFPSSPSPSSGVSELLTPAEIPLSPCSEIPSIAGSAFSTPSALTPVEEWENEWERPKDSERILSSQSTLPHFARRYSWTPRVVKQPLESDLGLSDGALARGAAAGANCLSASASGQDAASGVGATRLTSKESVAAKLQPNPSSHVPLLSFFSSLLSTDRATRDLILTSSVRPLFDRTAFSRDREAELDVFRGDFQAASDAHGIGKFVISMSEEAPLFRGPKKPNDDNPPIPPALHLSDVLQIVTGIGGQLLYVALRV